MPKSRTRKQRQRRTRTRRQHGGDELGNFVQSNVAKPAANNLLTFNKPAQNNAGLHSVFPKPGHALTRHNNGRRNLIYGNALATAPKKSSWWPF